MDSETPHPDPILGVQASAEQSMMWQRDCLPAHWKAMHWNLLSSGFTEGDAMRILLAYIVGFAGGKVCV